jgi:iron(III) transport system substrate-binding protein
MAMKGAMRFLLLLTAALAVGVASVAHTAAQSAPVVTIYSGRARALVQPLLDEFTKNSGVQVRVRYGDTAGLAATIIEEGANSPADVYYAQDAGALGAVAYSRRLRKLPDDILNRLEPRFRSVDGNWVGTSGRARVLAYNTRKLSPRDLPSSIWDLTDSKWRGRIGWAPTNGSFQAHVTAMRLLRGDDRTARWLSALKANGTRTYPGNPAIVEAIASGEIDAGLVNHYYVFGFIKERGESFPVRNHMFAAGDAGNLINVSGVGIVDTSRSPAASRLVEYLLTPAAQRYFSAETFEYPLIAGVPAHPQLLPLSRIEMPKVDLNHLQALETTLRLFREAGIL